MQVRPLAIPAVLPPWRRGRLARVAFEPVLDHVMVVLLGPQQPGQRLPHHVLRIGRKSGRHHRRVKLVGLALPGREDLIESDAKRFGRVWRRRIQAKLQRDRGARSDRERVVRGRLGAALGRVDRLHLAVDQVTMEGVLGVARAVVDIRTRPACSFRFP